MPNPRYLKMPKKRATKVLRIRPEDEEAVAAVRTLHSSAATIEKWLRRLRAKIRGLEERIEEIEAAADKVPRIRLVKGKRRD